MGIAGTVTLKSDIQFMYRTVGISAFGDTLDEQPKGEKLYAYAN